GEAGWEGTSSSEIATVSYSPLPFGETGKLGTSRSGTGATLDALASFPRTGPAVVGAAAEAGLRLAPPSPARGKGESAASPMESGRHGQPRHDSAEEGSAQRQPQPSPRAPLVEGESVDAFTVRITQRLHLH